jgi:hypothetical protein
MSPPGAGRFGVQSLDEHNPKPNVDRQNDVRANESYSGLDYWRKRLASVSPTIFPLRSSLSSGSVVDTSIIRRFSVPHEGVILQHGIKLSTTLTLAYALVLRAHSNSSDEAVFGYVHHHKR